MSQNYKIEAFKYFIDQYYYLLNGGGTFTLDQLIEEFKRYEKANAIEDLRNDAKYLDNELIKEDWEIKKSISDYLFSKGSKRNMKRIVKRLLERL